jgi:hypothetical protein
MTKPKDDDGCPRWCEWQDEGGHFGPHIRHVGEVLLSHAEPAYTIAVTIESRTREPEPMLTVGGRYTSYAQAAMTWAECDRLASLLTTARHRYG